MSLLKKSSIIFNIFRQYKNKNSLTPVFLNSGETLNEFDQRLYSIVNPPEKVKHNLSNYTPIITKFMARMVQRGKREVVREVMQKTIAEIKHIQLSKWKNAETDRIRTEIDLDFRSIIEKGLENCSPKIMIKEYRKGGVIYQVPVKVQTENESQHMGSKFILESVENRDKDIRIWFALSKEFISAANNEGPSVRKKKDLYKLCDEHRAFAHIRQSKSQGN